MTLEELEQDYGITPQSMAEAMETHVRGWFCEAEGRAVGFAMGDRSNGEVQVVAVRPGYEGLGIGKTLLVMARDWLFAQGNDEIWAGLQPRPWRARPRLLPQTRLADDGGDEGRGRGDGSGPAGPGRQLVWPRASRPVSPWNG